MHISRKEFSVSMSRVARLCLVASLFLAVTAAQAQSKVGIINLQKALLDTAEMKKAQAEMEARYKPRQDAIDKLQKEIADLQRNLQANAGKLQPAAEQEMLTRGQRAQVELKRQTEDLQADVDRDRNDILQRGGQRIQEVIKKVAEAQTLDVVVDSGNTLYFKPALDLTPAVTAEYDKTYPVK
jgi:outer membrane protein